MKKEHILKIIVICCIFAVAYGLGYYSGNYNANKESNMLASELHGTFEFQHNSSRNVYLAINAEKKRYYMFYADNEKVIESGFCRIEKNSVILYKDGKMIANMAYFGKKLWIIGDSIGKVEVTKCSDGLVHPQGHES